MFGKLMSISDDLMWKYYLLSTDLLPAEIEVKKKAVASGELHPMDAKRELARMIIRDFHSTEAAEKADAEFRRIFTERQPPSELDELRLPAEADPVPLLKILMAAKVAPSNNEARRLIAQGGVNVDEVKVDDTRASLQASAGKSYLIKVGKRRFVRVTFE